MVSPVLCLAFPHAPALVLTGRNNNTNNTTVNNNTHLRYCRFFEGRRSGDDERQIGRWLKCCGPTGRWKGNLVGKVLISGRAFNDPAVAPVVRQTLLHW